MKGPIIGDDWMLETYTAMPYQIAHRILLDRFPKVARGLKVDDYTTINMLMSRNFPPAYQDRIRDQKRQLEEAMKLRAELEQHNKHLEEQLRVSREQSEAERRSRTESEERSKRLEELTKIEKEEAGAELARIIAQLEAERRSRTELEERSKLEKEGAGAERLSMETALKAELAQIKVQLQTSEQALEIERKSKAESPMFFVAEDNFFAAGTASGREKSSSISSTSSYVEVGALGEVAEA